MIPFHDFGGGFAACSTAPGPARRRPGELFLRGDFAAITKDGDFFTDSNLPMPHELQRL